MGTFVIAGGSSGVGLQSARELLGAGHEVVILGRDKRNGQDALESFGSARERASFRVC